MSGKHDLRFVREIMRPAGKGVEIATYIIALRDMGGYCIAESVKMPPGFLFRLGNSRIFYFVSA